MEVMKFVCFKLIKNEMSIAFVHPYFCCMQRCGLITFAQELASIMVSCLMYVPVSGFPLLFAF